MPEESSVRYFRDIAKFYDPFSELPDADMYLKLAKRFGSPILELASGTGRISFVLAKAGYEVTGIEAAPEMLDVAKDKLSHLSKEIQDRVTFLQGDMSSFQINKQFSMIIIPWSFKYLLTTADQLHCLKQVRAHLHDHGVFILDLYPSEITAPEGTKSHTLEINGATITRTNTYSMDLIEQLRRCEAQVDIVYADGKTEHIETRSANALIFPREAELLVRTAGFDIVEDYGGNDLSEYKPGDWKRVMILKKRPE